MTNKDKLTGIIYLLMILFALVGIIGGIGWLLVLAIVHGDAVAWLPIIGLVVTAFMVWPVVKELARRI